MQMFSFDASTARAVTRFESRFVITPLVRSMKGPVHVQCARLESNGLIGNHPAVAPQLFLVVEGSGWVRGEEKRAREITAGQAVFWKAGESHETGTAEGLSAIIIEGDGVYPSESMKSI